MNHNPVVPNAPPTMSCVTEDCRRDIPVYCDGEGRVLIQRYSASSPDCDTTDKYTWTSELGQDTGCGYMVEPIVRMLAADATAITPEMSVEDDGVTDYTDWPTIVGTGWVRTNHTDALEALRNGSHWQTREIAASWEQSEPDKYCFVSEDGADDKADHVYSLTIQHGYVTRWPDMIQAFDGLCFHWIARPGGQFYGEEGQTQDTEKYSGSFPKFHSPMLSSFISRMRGLQMSSTWLTMKPGFCCLPQENVESFKNPKCEIEKCQTNTSLNEAGDKCCADRAGALTYGNDCQVVRWATLEPTLAPPTVVEERGADSAGSNAGLIIGIVVGVSLCLALIGVAAFVVMRSKKKNQGDVVKTKKFEDQTQELLEVPDDGRAKQEEQPEADGEAGGEGKKGENVAEEHELEMADL